MPFDVQCVTEFAAAPPDQEWHSLLARSAAHPVFLSRQFQQSWWDCFCCDSSCTCQLCILILRDGGTLVGVAPFYLSVQSADDTAAEQRRAQDWQRILARAAGDGERPGARTAQQQLLVGGDAEPPPAAPRLGERVLRLGGGVEVTDSLDIIAAGGQEAAVWRAVLAYWSARAADWDVLDLHSLAPAARARAQAAAADVAPAWAIWSAVEETCPAVPLPGDWDAYLAQLGKKDRHELRRKLRRAESAPVSLTWKLYTDGPEMASALDGFIELHRLSGEAKAEFMTPAMARFFRRLGSAFAGTGWLEVAMLYAGDQPAAAYLAFHHDSQLLLYNSGYDPAFAEWSAGFVLLVYRIERALAQGIRVLDFLRGDERYKYDLGAGDQFIYRVIIRK